MSHYDIHVGDVIKYPEMVMARTVYYFLFLLGGENTVKLASREQAPCGMRACWDYITVCSLNSCNISGDQNFKAERNDFRRVEGSFFR